jgi:hypothetical protein
VLEQLPRGRLLPDEPWRRRHRGIVLFLAAHVAALAALALLAGFPPLHAVADVAPVAACAALASWHRLSRRLGSVVASLGLVASSALLVHLWAGAGEAHFHFFLVIGLLTLYQDWLPFLVALAAIVAHHLIVWCSTRPACSTIRRPSSIPSAGR